MKTDRSCARVLFSAALFGTTILTTANVLVAPAYAQATANKGSTGSSEEPLPQGETEQAAASPSEDIVVTARVGGQIVTSAPIGLLGTRDRLDMPFSTTSVTDQLVRNLQANTLAEVLANDPSVRQASDRFSNAEVLTIRGFRLSASEATLNGLGGMVPFRRIPYESIERVDLVRGPVGLLVGSTPGSGIAGSLNYVTKKAGPDPITRLTANYFSDGNFGGAIDFARRLGTTEQFGFRINAAYREGATPLDRQSESSGVIALNFDWRSGPFSISVDGGYFDQTYQVQSPALFLAAGATLPALPDIRATLSPDWSRASVWGTYAMARARLDLTDSIFLTAAYGHQYNREFTLLTILTGLQSNGNVSNLTIATPRKSKFDSADIQLHAEFDTGPVKHKMVLIANRTPYKAAGPVNRLGQITARNIYLPFNDPEPDISNLNRDYANNLSDNLLTSFAAADFMSILDERVQFLAGARLQRIASDLYLSPTGTGEVTSTYDEKKLTPAFAVIVKPLENLSLYGNYIEGLVATPSAPRNAANASQQFAPTAASQYEAGVKFDSGKIGAQLSYYQIKQPLAFLDPATNIFGVIGLQRNRGFEMQIFGEPTEGLRFIGGASTLNARLVRTAGGAFDGNVAPASPRLQYSFAPEIDLSFAPELTLTGRISYTGKAYLDPQNTQRAPSYTKFDVGARYTVEVGDTALTFRANIDNVTNKNAWLAIQGGGLVRLTPRTLRLSVEAAF